MWDVIHGKLLIVNVLLINLICWTCYNTRNFSAFDELATTLQKIVKPNENALLVLLSRVRVLILDMNRDLLSPL